MIVSEFLQSLRAGDTEAVLLRVDKAQLVLLLSSSDTIKTTIHPPRADLVWELSLAEQDPVLFLLSWRDYY